MRDAQHLFGEMPRRDVVSWNTMVSGFYSIGLAESAMGVVRRMREEGVRASPFTFSIAISFVSTALQVRELHGSSLRCGFCLSHVVVGNSLIDKYGKVGIENHAIRIFNAMEEHDIVTWNSMISLCERSGQYHCALQYFWSMREVGLCVDHFTMSTVITVCASIGDLNKDWRNLLNSSKKCQVGGMQLSAMP